MNVDDTQRYIHLVTSHKMEAVRKLDRDTNKAQNGHKNLLKVAK